MSTIPFQRFYGKLLLFGEYVIIKGAVGLAVPFNRFHMEFVYAKDQHTIRKSTALLEKFLIYTRQHFSSKDYDFEGFENDIKQGLCVSSTIPIGYGLGSSGALVACFFHSYCINKVAFEDINVLKKELGLLEGYFHGDSSGLDPLVSYLSNAVLIESKDKCSKIQIDPSTAKDLDLFILNSSIERRTAPLVDIFKEKLSNSNSFAKMIETELLPLNNEIIQAYIHKDVEIAKAKIKQLSLLQYENFKEMIPTPIATIWKEGLDSGAYSIKLCGAGGGGYFMGFGDPSSIKDYEVIAF